MPGCPAPRALALLFVPLLLSSFALDAGAQSAPATLALIPLVFEPNQGQAQPEYRFLARRGSTQAMFREDGVDILISQSQSARTRLRMRWLGAAPAVSLSASDAFPSHSSYFRGSDPSHWVRGVPNFARLRYGQLYPGIDLVFHGREGMIEHDFELHRGADPGQIRLSFDGSVRLDRSGNLMVDVGQAEMALLRPAAYQEMAGGRREIPARFVLDRHGVVKFRVGPYDKTRDLIIDPVFVFSTYLDGTNSDSVTSVTTDAAGNVFVGGYTSSTDFPITNVGTPLCSTCTVASSTTEAFISKLDPTGHTLLFSAFLGGSNGALIYSVGVDNNGNMYVGGTTGSFDFPHSGSVPPLTPTLFNHSYYFAASIKPDGSALNYSGLVGGTAGVFDRPGKMIVDALGNAYLTGTTDDPNFQLTPGTLNTTPPGYPNDNLFVLRLDPTGKLLYSTLVPSNTSPTLGFMPGGLSVDTSGQVTIAGTAGLGLPTTSGVVAPTMPSPQNVTNQQAGFVLQLNAAATALNFSTYLPGTDNANAMAVNANGDIYITGPTSETNLPVSANAYQKALIPGQYCVCGSSYVMELDSHAKTILAATYLSGTPAIGNEGTYLMGIALDSKSNVLVGGMTGSTDFPLKNPFVTTLQFSTSADSTIVAELSSDLSSLPFGSYLSSSSASYGGSSFSAITVDPKDHPIVVGTTLATDFPTTSNAYLLTPPAPANTSQTFFHAFISELDLSTPAPSVCLSPSSIDFGSILINTTTSANLYITNCGDAPLQISSVSSSESSVTAGPGCRTVAVGITCTLQLTFSPTASTSSTSFATLTLTDNAAIATQTVGLSSAVGSPLVQIPASFQVDDLLVGAQSNSGIGFINRGNANWIVSNVTATGDFSAVNRCTQPLAPFNPSSLPPPVCSIGIIFSPTAAGLRTGTLTISDNQAGTPHIVQLLGNALAIYATPSISQILAVPTDAVPATLQIAGNNFFPASQVLVNGSPRTTTYQGETLLSANLSTSDLAQVGELSVTVSTPAPGGGLSNASIATVYAAIRNVGLLHTVYRPKNGHLYASVAAQSTSYAGRVIEIDPATAKVVNSWTVGNGPNQLAISDDGQFLYVGLDSDKTVAQVALPAGTVNFAVGLGNDDLFGNPMVADALRVPPGQPHTWAVSLCGVGYIPCGEGVAVFDDSVKRPAVLIQDQLEPDALLFIGSDATKLYGTTLFQLPSSFYKFAINSTGISLSQTAQNFAGQSQGGGALDTDGTLIYVNNGQVIDPATLAIQSGGFQPLGFSSAFAVDPPASHVYFAGSAPFDPTSLLSYRSVIQAFGLTSQQPTGLIPIDEGIGGDMFRWGTNGLAITGGTGMLLVQTSLTNQTAPLPEFSVSSLAPVNVVAGSPDLALTIAGSGFASGDALTANGISLQIGAITPTQITTTVPAGLISIPGDVQIAVSDTNNHVFYLVLVVGPGPTAGVAISTNYLTFGAQIVGTSSSARTVTILNNGSVPLVISGIALTGDFSEANTCGTVAPGGNCTAAVTFQPTVTGSRSGALTISDNDPSKSQTIALSGTGADIQIAPASGSSSLATVTSGQPATYALSIVLDGGFTGRFSFACSNLPQFAACTFNPASAVLGTSPVSVSVTISTSQSQSATGNWFGFGPSARTVYLLAVILGLMVCITVARLDKRRPALATILLFLAFAVLPLTGCASGTSSASTPPPPVVSTTPAGTYTVNFTVTNSQISRTIPLTLIVK